MPTGLSRLSTLSSINERPSIIAVGPKLESSASPVAKELLVLARLQQRARLLGGVCILVVLPRIAGPLDLGHNGRLDLLVVQRSPVQSPEPLVLFDVLGRVLQVADALCAVCGEQLAHEVTRVRLKVARELELAREDLLVDPEGVLVVKRRVARQHFVDEDAERPPVHRLSVPFGLDDLGREVLGCATQRPCSVLNVLGEAEVGDFQVALIV
mmetsp:Transcript_4360/g.11304  ORF Transcript_4360/g.11304 Transcript_4360/m.11304 type:complete len:212 (+) Transcript_4360:158-793(+)